MGVRAVSGYSGKRSGHRMSGSGGPAPVALAAPVALGYTAPFTVYKSGASYTTDFSMAAVKPTPANTVYVGAGGNNANTGLTWALRVRSLRQALVKAQGLSGVIRILAQVGQYRYSNNDGTIPDSFDGQDFSRNIIIEPCDASGNPVATGVVASIQNQILPAFSLLSNAVYASTYTTELPGPGMWDLSLLNSKGNPQALRYAPGAYANEAAIIAGVAAQATAFGVGACYIDTVAKKVYIRTRDSRAPDANIEVSRGDSNSNAPGSRNLTLGGIFGSPMTVWMDRIQLWGGNGLYVPVYEPDGRNVITYWSDGATLYSGNSGVGVDGTSTTTLLRHTSWDNYGDGCNYDQSNGLDPTAIAVTRFHEISCDLQWNGNDSVGESSKNATSSHMRSKGVRVNGLAQYTQNRAYHDIQDAKTWNLGCVSALCRQTGVQSGTFVSGSADLGLGQTSEMWLDGCTSTHGGSQYDLQAYQGGDVHTKNMVTGGFTNLISGTGSVIDTY